MQEREGKMKKFILTMILVLTLTQSFAQEKPDVVVSFFPLYDFTRNIGGDRIDLTSLIPFSVEPHDWEPGPRDMVKVSSADIFIYNGAGLEPWADDIIKSVRNKKLKVVDISKSIRVTGEDPHIWLDPILVKSQLKVIKDTLIAHDPENRTYYDKNYNVYLKKIEELDREIRKTIARCKKKVFVTSHDAFSRFAERYGLTQVPVMGISPESEPSPRELAGIIETIKRYDVRYIFTEPFIPIKIAESISRETGVKILVLDPIEGLTEEEMKSGADYLSKMKKNLENLKIALEYE